MSKLTALRQAFVREFLISPNGADAARKAGYKGKRLDQTAYELLRIPEVAEAIAAGQKEMAEKAQRTALDVLKDIQDVSREARDGGDLKTALRGYELEGKHLGMFMEKLQLSGNLNLAAAIEEGRKRVNGERS